MASVTIGGKTYRLGDIAGTAENFEIVGMLMALETGGANMAVLLPGARRLLQEAITAAEGLEAADAAMNMLSLKLKPGSDFWHACTNLIASIME